MNWFVKSLHMRNEKEGNYMKYDILFFEALGEENAHIHEAIAESKAAGNLPADMTYFVTTENFQEWRAKNPAVELPNIISTKTHSRLPESWLNEGEKKSLLSRSAGYDHFEHLANIANVTSLRRYCVNAVAETAIKLMMCACGNLNQYTNNTPSFERNNCVSFKELTGLKVTVFGVGNIGRRIYELCKGMGTDVRAVDVREKELSAVYGDEVRFISKEEAIDSDVVICAMNYTAFPESRFYNKSYFTAEYLSKFPKGLVFVNVTRGEIAPEGELLKVWENGNLFGIGLDVFSGEAGLTKVLRGEKEPETENEKAGAFFIRSAIDRTANIYVQPHQAFNSDVAALCKAEETIRHLEAYYRNGQKCFDSQLPYYL